MDINKLIEVKNFNKINAIKEFKKCIDQIPVDYSKIYDILALYSETDDFRNLIKEYIPDKDYKMNIDSSEKFYFDFEIETLAWAMAFNTKPVECSIEAELEVYELYPYLIYNIMYMRTIKQQREYFKNIKEKYKELRGDFVGKLKDNIEIFENYLDNYDENKKNNSALVNFNYLAGIRFDQVNKKYSDLPENYLMINIGYDFYEKEGTKIFKNLIYGNTEDIKGIAITKKEVEQNKPNQFVSVYSTKDYYAIVRRKKELNKFWIVINYNNDRDEKKCNYSISKNYCPFEIVQILINGGTIYKVKNQTMKVYFAEMLNSRKGKAPYLEVLKNYKKYSNEMLSKASIIAKKYYNEDVNKTISNWKGFAKNDPIFDVWIDKLHDFVDIDKETHKEKLNYENYINTIYSYFMPLEDYVD